MVPCSREGNMVGVGRGRGKEGGGRFDKMWGANGWF